MAIVVVCPSCHARFQVNDKFAGKEGPCPKCKTKIKVPELADEVKIHVPEFGGPGAKDAKGRSVLKPIERVEAKVKPAVVAGIVGSIILAFVAAFFLRGMVKAESSSAYLVLGVGAFILAPPLVLGGYSFLRNQELEPYRGQALVVRVAICSIVYAGLWGGVWAMKHFLVGEAGSIDTWKYFVFVGPPLLIGGLTSLATLDLDYGSGCLHYALYLVICVLLRLTMKLPVL